MLRRVWSTIMVISALLFTGTTVMKYRSRSTRDAVAWTTQTGKLVEINFDDGISIMGAAAETPRLKMLTGWGVRAPEFFADTAKIRMLEYERDTFEEAHFLILERDGKILKDLHDDVPLAKQQLMDAIAQEEIGLGPRRTDPIRGEYSDIGFLGLYVGSGMAGTLNIPPGNIIHPDRIAGAAITRVHLSLFRIRFPLLAILTGALPFTRLFSLTRRSLVRTHRRRNNRCPGCGYDLRGSPERCPECGEQNSANSTPLHAS